MEIWVLNVYIFTYNYVVVKFYLRMKYTMYNALIEEYSKVKCPREKLVKYTEYKGKSYHYPSLFYCFVHHFITVNYLPFLFLLFSGTIICNIFPQI